ncbi:Protein with similarity to the human NPC2/He1 [Komagataella phaffii CBS 7435]|uniref:Phosphatidylglycerol/phosphatidylinositol transfer protein n=2 Tax=Komagataella phaffii TaxID=460519 RepID=C4QZC2_KOMPG|nr:Phosphatidylglycerol/phosphatidylinositol transfer protein [Komagataella phaffii GS115]AOA60375.1 GQ67_01396T0 [Komagataella phaffii]CAH2447428.1 Protein with similarity to the human NPC2/He1 [Komagataella phaffii CBS 7435]AOA65747.1 GQ68_01412T0 [Komagataella phaffii GS115]CAY68596.1 Phosphatidylglycerol/phosphatidylinositol transfer protein [Komagataella phaffii GS115]CCA37657.1 Protein with similarity to the human NPC2/He1 [Komagataella phaffii CBS 7435]
MLALVRISTLLLLALTASASLIPFQGKLTFPGQDLKPVPGDSPIANCDVSQKQLLTLKEVDLSPNPPQRGVNLTITAIGDLDVAVTEGAYVEIDVTYGYIKLIHQTFDICSEIQNVDLECPLDKGHYELTKEVEIPQQVPPGKYTVFARAFTADDKFITCLTGSVEFGPENFSFF